MSRPPQSASYRPDIDGLRAIAVLGVIAFHAAPGLLKGGFVGVDVFFVFSGYLISGIIFAELEQGKFSYTRFYGRRIRRIFPSLILVLVACFGIGWYVLFPSEFQQLGKHIAAAAAFVLNLVLIRESGYFDAASQAKPLLHLWSLAVEEQFYLIWPFVLCFAWRRKTNILSLIFVIALASFVLGVESVPRTMAFYSPIGRFWELMAGSALAYVTSHHGSTTRKFSALLAGIFVKRARWKSIFSQDRKAFLGCALIVLAMLLTPARRFPGLWTFLPIVGSCLIISAGRDAWVNKTILSRPAFVRIGLISYPLYLWHWPLLSFAWIINGGTPSLSIRLGIVAASFCLAYFTYVAWEQPIRFGLHSQIKTLALGGLSVVIGVTGYATDFAHGFTFRPIAQVNEALAEDLRVPTGSRTSDSSCAKLLGIMPAVNETCLVNAARPKFLVIGDSQAMAFNSSIYADLVHIKTALVSTNMDVWAHQECLDGQDFKAWLSGNAACVSVVRHALAIAAKESSIDTVVMAFQGSDAFFRDRRKIFALQTALRSMGKKIVYVLDVPIFKALPSSCLPRIIRVFGRTLSEDSYDSICKERRSDFEQQHRNTKLYLKQLRGDDPKILIYDPLPAFCDVSYCYEGDDKGVLYWWIAHVNERGSKKLLTNFLIWLNDHTAGGNSTLPPRG